MVFGLGNSGANRAPLCFSRLSASILPVASWGSMLTDPEEIDALLAADKFLAGRPAWSRSRETTVRISVPLQVGDAIVGGLFLAGTASVHNALQDGSLVLQYQGQVVERMSVFPTAPHANPLDKRLSP